jgi:hypothetical protein
MPTLNWSMKPWVSCTNNLHRLYYPANGQLRETARRLKVQTWTNCDKRYKISFSNRRLNLLSKSNNICSLLNKPDNVESHHKFHCTITHLTETIPRRNFRLARSHLLPVRGTAAGQRISRQDRQAGQGCQAQRLRLLYIAVTKRWPPVLYYAHQGTDEFLDVTPGFWASFQPPARLRTAQPRTPRARRMSSTHRGPGKWGAQG